MKPSRVPFIRFAAGLLLLGALRFPCTAAETPAWTLRPSVVVGTGGVFLADVVDAATNAPVLPELRLTNAPVVGHATVITRALIEAALRQHVRTGVPPRWEGAGESVVTRRTRPLEEAEVLERLTAALQKSYVGAHAELELQPTRPWVPPVIADEPGTLRILDIPAAGLSASFIVRFELRVGRESLGIWQVPLQARVWRDVFVAGGLVQRGTTLADAGFLRERRDTLAIRDVVGALPSDAAGFELAEPMSPGSVLTTRMIRQRPVVTRGHLVDAMVQEGGLTISMRALALEDGLPGQIIRVRNPRSQKEFNGKVQNADTVLVTL